MSDDCISESTRKKLDALVEEAFSKEDEYVEYDGINGMPPDWIPEWAVNHFVMYRTRLLQIRGYTHDELLVWIKRYEDSWLADGEFEWWWPRKYPNREPVDRYAFQDEIGFLAWIWWCSKQDKQIALDRLGGGFAVKGLNFSGGASKKKGKEFEPKKSIRRICDKIDSFKFDEVLNGIKDACRDTFDSDYYFDEPLPFTDVDFDDEIISFEDNGKQKNITFKTLKNHLADLRK